jgi:hypothetical protein
MGGSSRGGSPLTANMFETLPTELILDIFELVDKADLKSLRFVLKRFNVIAPVILFRSVSASPHAQDLEILRLISKHEAFRHHVQEITYFEVYFHVGFHYDIPNESLDPTLQPDVHVSAIASAIARMPKLQRLILKNHWFQPRANPSYLYSDEEAVNTALYGPHTSRRFSMATLKPHCIAAERGRRTFDFGFKVMCKALAISDIRLRSFFIDYVQTDDHWVRRGDEIDTSGLRVDTLLKMSPHDVEHACKTFRHLRQISLSLFYQVTLCPGAKDNLAKILAATENLEDLRLNFGDRCPSRAYLKDCFKACTWPRLRTLHLSNAFVDGKELANIVYRHRRTLKSLHLWRIYLQNNDWWTWAKSVQPWISSGALEQIEFTTTWYENRYKESKLRKKRVGAFWIKSECCLRNYILLGYYKRDCCHTSRFLSKNRTDEEIIKILHIVPPKNTPFELNLSIG